MDFFEVVKRRHSYRGQFLPQRIPDEDIRTILDAGIRAPSGYNLQSTTFVAVTDPLLRSEIYAILPGNGTKTAPLIVVVVTEKVTGGDFGLTFEIEDYGAATENVVLAVTALGYATVWIDGATQLQGRSKAIGALLNVPEGKTVKAVLPIGVPMDKKNQLEKRAFEDRVVFNRFNVEMGKKPAE